MLNDGDAPKILIVDDIPKNIQIVGNILQEENYDIYFANSGETAIKQTQNNDFDLILLDIMMPVMDGYEVCKYLKDNQTTKNIPIIFLTAKSDTESTVHAFEIGGVDYLTKPFNGTELLARIKTHLNLLYSRRKLEEKNKQIEEQKRKLEDAYQKLVESEKCLKELNATKDKFFSIIAHDLKNPFNTLIGFTDFLNKYIEKIDRKKEMEMIQMIHNASRNGFNLLENLLEWSRAQTGRISFRPLHIRLAPLVNESIDLLTTTAEKKEIRLESNVADETMVFADEDMINTVLRNLISNALKFTNKGGKVSVNERKRIKNGKKYIQITISDTGIGISPEDQKKLFRIDVSHRTIGTSEEKGTGLGLILCKEFVEVNGGWIFVESESQKGSNFHFTLPVEKTETSEYKTENEEKVNTQNG